MHSISNQQKSLNTHKKSDKQEKPKQIRTLALLVRTGVRVMSELDDVNAVFRAQCAPVEPYLSSPKKGGQG